MKNLFVAFFLTFLAACNFPIPMWPDLPDKGTCRNFYMTDWGGSSPTSELTWKQDALTPQVPPVDIVFMDEPMLPFWGWPGDPNSAEDVCGAKGLGMVRAKLAAMKAANPNSKTWVNWSTDELGMIAKHCPGVPYGQGADIVSFDSYGGIWDWPHKTEYLLNMLYRQLEPNQQMGLVPEAFIIPDALEWKPIDYVMINTLYFNWAMEHDGWTNAEGENKIYAFAPFYYNTHPGMFGYKDMPQVRDLLEALPVEYPRCQP
jgi:hypothetical protein